MPGDSTAWTDVVVAGDASRAAAVTVVEQAGEHADLGLRDGPPDLRHANRTAIELLLRRLDAPAVVAVHVATARLDDATAPELALRALGWLAWTAAREPLGLTTIGLAKHPGVLGAGDAAERLPAPAEVTLAWRRVRRSAELLGLAPVDPPPLVTLAYGLPATPTALVRARLAAHATLLGIPLPVVARKVVRVPSPRVLRDLDDLAALAGQDPPSPMAIGRAAARLTANGGAPGLAGLAGHVLTRLAAGADAPERRGPVAAMLRATIGEIAGILDARQGDYEACEQVLRALVDRPAPGQKSVAEQTHARDPWALANALLARARVANHRGDARAAAQAARDAATIACGEDSARGRILRLEARNLSVVAAQNEWPFLREGLARTLLDETAAELEREVNAYTPLVAALGPPVPAARPRLAVGPWREPDSGYRDPVLGAALGTLGRSLAFLGRHDDAVGALLLARSHFVSALDLSVNACFLAHVELDRAAPDAARLQAVLDRLVDVGDRAPDAFAARLAAGDLGCRFALDVLLKALALGVPVPGASVTAWCDALADPDALRGPLAAMRTHPTELVARHAAELLARAGRRADARPWFELGIDVGRAGAPAMQRIARFTEALAADRPPDPAQPRGSVLAPCYEHR